MEKLFADITGTCERLADPVRGARYTWYFKDGGYDPYGIDHKDPEWIAAKTRWLEENRSLNLSGFIVLGQRLVATGKYEAAGLAIWFVSQFRAQYGPRTFPAIARWFDVGLANWALCDTICSEVLSAFLLDGVVPVGQLKSWCASNRKYRRRAAAVMCIAPVTRGDNCQPMLNVLTPLMTDKEKVVQQGMGWFLREAWKRQAPPVERLLLDWRDTAPRLIFQYATEKMTPAAKERFRKQTRSTRERNLKARA
jgi:3-methyladenine DNA glycosylase AlkD